MAKSEHKPTKPHKLGDFTPSQRAYIKFRRDNPQWSKAKCAKAAGVLPSTVYKWSPDVENAVIAFEESAHEQALRIRGDAVAKATARLVALVDSEDESIALKAATLIMEHELGKPVNRTQLTGDSGGAIQVQHMPALPDSILDSIVTDDTDDKYKHDFNE